MKGSLSAYRFLDLTDEKGTLCTRLLAGMGAEVIRVEPPGGDPTRDLGPFVNDVPHRERSLFFQQYNLSKRSVTLNLQTAEGRVLFLRLVEKADGLVESGEPGYLESLGLGDSTLRARRPGLVMASITPFGQDGPRRRWKASDLTLAALGGQACLNGESDTPPLKLYGNQTYHLASLFAATGVLLALRHRRATGRGQYIDVSIQECVAAGLDHALVRYFSERIISRRQGSTHWTRGFRLFPCRDGHVLLSLFQDWEVLVEWLDGEGMAGDLTDEKWRRREVRLEGMAHVVEVLEEWTRSHTAEEIVEKGQLMRFPWAKAATVAELVDNPQLRDRGFFVRVEHPEEGTGYEYPGPPYRMTRAAASPPRQAQGRLRRAPLIGEDNEAVYCEELGLSEAELASLKERGII